MEGVRQRYKDAAETRTVIVGRGGTRTGGAPACTRLGMRGACACRSMVRGKERDLWFFFLLVVLVVQERECRSPSPPRALLFLLLHNHVDNDSVSCSCVNVANRHLWYKIVSLIIHLFIVIFSFVDPFSLSL